MPMTSHPHGMFCSQTVLWSVILVAPVVACAQDPSAAANPTIRLELSESFQRVITELVSDAVPHNYEDTKNWGKTREVVRGLYIKREGLRIKTHRTRKTVNDGTWTRYRIELVDPAQHFQVHIERFRALPTNRMAFEIRCKAHVRTFGRLSQWQRGVQLISLSAEADAEVRLIAQCELAIQLDRKHTIPDIQLKPVVCDADLQIDDFRIRKVSRLDGPLVKKLSASMREVLEDQIAKRRPKLVAKINRQIEKRRDRLRLSFAEIIAFQKHEPSSSGSENGQ